MKYSILDLTQAVLSSMDSSPVNSITDTTESMQVATLIRTVFFDLVSKGNLPENYTWFNLVSSGDSTKPTLMYLPDDAVNIMGLKYNIATTSDPDMAYVDINSFDRKEFTDRMYQLNQSDSNVGSFSHILNGYTANFLYTNDAAPTEYTLFADNIVIFNSFDSSVDTTLQSSKTEAYGKKNYTWTMSDTFVPPIDDEQFAILLNECKSLAWAELKQTQHAKAEANAQRGLVHSQKTKDAIKLTSDFDKLPYFGRR